MIHRANMFFFFVGGCCDVEERTTVLKIKKKFNRNSPSLFLAMKLQLHHQPGAESFRNEQEDKLKTPNIRY